MFSGTPCSFAMAIGNISNSGNFQSWLEDSNGNFLGFSRDCASVYLLNYILVYIYLTLWEVVSCVAYYVMKVRKKCYIHWLKYIEDDLKYSLPGFTKNIKFGRYDWETFNWPFRKNDTSPSIKTNIWEVIGWCLELE